MKRFAYLLLLIAPVAFASDIADAPDTVSLTVRYVDEDLRPMDASHLPQRIRFNIRPIPGGIGGVPLGVNLLDVEVKIGDTIDLDLVDFADRVAPIALPMQKNGSFRTADVVPEDVKVVRLGTFAASAGGPRINASTGMAAGADRPLTQVLVWFDRAVSITGNGVSDDLSFEFDISAPGEGFRWVQYDEYEPGSYRVTDRSIDASPYVTLEILQVEWVVLEKRDDEYWLMGRAIEGAEHLIWLLRDAGAMALMLGDGQGWSISDISHLGPMLDGSEFVLLYRGVDGTVRRVEPGQYQ
ncbi:MAG: hypothetical protein QNI99_00890 [Woeseiaceae bacterium]|nr:hypothetical protein [Woeseiaceae bacterium]